MVSVGTNLSSFLHEEGEWQLGYNLGLTFNVHLYKNLSMTLPFSYTRINASPKNVESQSIQDVGEYIYKTLTDWQLAVGVIEIPLLFTYKFFSKNRYDISYIVGLGLGFTEKDYSRIEKFTKTDEIIGVERYGYPLEPQHPTPPLFGNIYTGIRFHKGRFYIDLLYAYYPDNIKEINKLNSISLKLGIDFFKRKESI